MEDIAQVAPQKSDSHWNSKYDRVRPHYKHLLGNQKIVSYNGGT